MYKISIIIPVFNVKDTLNDAFNSILEQSIGFENLEIIFIDDSSDDGSCEIIKSLSEKYSNVKSIFLPENSGFAGKPRNIGINNSSTDYVMFLDPDDTFKKDACEILYNNIIEDNLNMVSGNYTIKQNSGVILNDWDKIGISAGQSVHVDSIEENQKLLLATPSVWSKIFNRKFLLDNNITFPAGIPGQDLVFVSQALLKAKGIKFINVPVVEYNPREKGDNISVTSQRTKKVLSGLIEAYTKLYDILFEYNPEYCWLAPRNLYFWTMQFCLSNIPIEDKIDLLHSAYFLYEKFIESDKLGISPFLNELFDYIHNKDFLKASIISNDLRIHYMDDAEIASEIKNKNIYFLFYGIDLDIGGLAKALFNRGNILTEHGYKVILLNIDELKNFSYIINYFKDIKFLDDSIEFINMFDYYAKLNTLNKNNPRHIYKKPSSDNVKETIYNDNTVFLDYYGDCEDIIKTEVYMNNILAISKKYQNGNISCEDYYTVDGFTYVTIKYEGNERSFTLYNRNEKTSLFFDTYNDFCDYFLTQILLENDSKAFLLNECSGPIPDFVNITPDLAYKIASIHTNPYKGNYTTPDSPAINVAALRKREELDYIVVLTEALKRDLTEEYGLENISAIYNFLNYNDYLNNENNAEKNPNKISMFARLSHEKNIGDVINAFKIVVDSKPEAVLEIFGRAVGPRELNEEKKLKDLVSKLNLEKNVIFRGHVDNVNEEMSNSIATVFASKFEGLGLVILESMINSTPVVSYDLKYGPSDFIIDGKTGYLAEHFNVSDLADKLLLILNDSENAITMGKSARQNVLEKLNSEELLSKWENVFKECFINDYPESFAKQTNERCLEEKIKRLSDINSELNKENENLKRDIESLKNKQNNNDGHKSKILKIFGR